MKLSSSSSIVLSILIGLLLLGNLSLTMSQQQQEDDVNNDFFRSSANNNICPAGIPKPTVSVGSSNNNATTTIEQYIFGCNTRFNPLLEYLNEIVGLTFEPPISFVRKHPNLYLKTKTVKEALAMHYDFMVTNPYQSSCFETESYAVPLATQIFRDTDSTHVDNRYYNLTQYGATLYVLANRTDIRTIQDVKGKIVGSNKITGLATHLCYDVLLRNGIHHLQDPKQTIFFKHSDHALAAILEGRIDVGCASTSTLETYRDATTGLPLDLSQIRILNPQNYTITTSDDGRSTTISFPYAISSHLVPAFPVTASPRVEQIVQLRVQKELIAMRDHADVAPSLLACLREMESSPFATGAEGCQTVNNNTQECLLEACFQSLLLQQSSNTSAGAIIRNCETTPQLALKAFYALNTSGLPGFTSPQQNYHLRDIQETTGFLKKDSHHDTDGTPRCVRLQNIEDAVTCPEGYFVRSSQEIVQQCNASGLSCYDVPCLCNPCVKAFEVDFFVVGDGASDSDSDSNNDGSGSGTKMMGSGCSKFSICGTVQQGHAITFRTIDNKERPNAKMTGAILRGDESIEPFTFVNDDFNNNDNETSLSSSYHYHYDFVATQRRVGQMIVKIWINNEEIPESPFRINIVQRDCMDYTGDHRREPDELGQCICQRGSVELSNKCVPWWTILVPCCLGLILLLGLAFYQYHLHQKKQREKEESLWMVQKDEILFDTPPTILGRGAFGLVMLGEFRGTKVAVKRVIVPQGLRRSNRSSGSADVSSNDVERGTTPSSNDGGGDHLPVAAGEEEKESPLPPAAAEEDTGAETESSKKVGGGGMEEDYSPTGVGVRLTSNPGEFKAPARDGAAELAARLSTAGFMHRSRGGSELFAKLMKLREDFVEEIRVLNRLRHPNVTTLMGAVLDDIDGPLIIMEYMDLGSLYDLLRNETKVLGEDVLLPILTGVSQGMRFLHACDPPFLHGDLKARNILLDSRYHAKVADFGLSHSQKECKKPVGTPYWTAPELLRGESLNTTYSDMYSFGVLLYEAYSRKEPYEGEDTMTVLVQVANPIVNKRPPIPSTCSPQIRSLMAECFVNTPEYRPTFEEVDQRLKRVDLKAGKSGCDYPLVNPVKAASSEQPDCCRQISYVSSTGGSQPAVESDTVA